MKHLYLSSALVCLLATQPAIANNLLDNKPSFNYPGGVVELIINKQSDSLPEVKFGVNEPVIIEQSESWRILVGLSLKTIPGEYLIYFKRNIDGATSEHVNFFVEQKSYSIFEHIKGINKKIRKTHSKLTELEHSNTQQPNVPLSLPVDGQWNTDFGSKHHNKKRKKLITQNQVYLPISNNIVSVRSPENALVSRIIIEKDASSTVFLDHGRGLYSIIGGLTEINVKTGNGVLSGAVIGKVTPDADFNSATVGTQNLTWQCILNGTYVNPITLTKI